MIKKVTRKQTAKAIKDKVMSKVAPKITPVKKVQEAPKGLKEKSKFIQGSIKEVE